MNIKRLIVHESRIDHVVKAFTKRLEEVTLGHGLDKSTTMGPLHSRSHKQYLNKLIDEAKQDGATVLKFSTLPKGSLANGNFMCPAIILNPKTSSKIVKEEQFGPVIPVLTFRIEEEAITLANDTWAGLGASVWSKDKKSADRIARKLACGYVWINNHGAAALDLRVPFGGMKQSGFGREQGIEGIRAFQDSRAISFPY